MPIVCAEGERMCFDGSCYAKREYLQKCTVPYNGCGPGYMECNTTFDSGVCRKSIIECEREHGCGKDEKLCGWERTSDGSMYSSKKSAVRKRICKKRCYFTQAMKPETKAQEVDTTASDTVIDLMTNDREGAAKRRSVRMRVKKGMLRRKTNFTFVDVPDSVRFSEKVVKKFGERVKAPMITIEPSEEVDFSQPGGIELEFPVLDEAAQESSVVCNALLLKLRAYKIDNILNATEDWAEMGRCKPARWSGGAECICKVNVTHFSTFAVAEEDELCGDNVPDGSCAVGEFFNAGTSACENCTVGKTSCGGGVGEDGCRCAEGGGFNGSVVGSTVIQHVEGNTECTISDEHCYPDENDAGAIADMEWLSDQYLLSLHLNTHVIYRHDTSVYPHTKTLFAGTKDVDTFNTVGTSGYPFGSFQKMVDMTIDTESNVVYIASCTSFFVYKMCSAGNTGKLNAVFYDPDTFTAISSLQYSNTFSGLSGILLIGHNLVIVHHDQNYLTEITLSGDKTSISSTTQHPFRDSSGTDISMSYYTNVFALDSSRSSIWIASSHSSDENFYQMNINTWRMTIHTGFFSKVGRDAVHNAKIYSRTVLFPPSGSLMYVGGYKIVVKDYLDGTGELLSGDNYNGGWFYEPWKNARTFNRFFEVQSLALSPDGLFLYVGSLDNKFGTIKRIALGLPETRATHTNMCSCVQDAVSSFGNLTGICVECPDVANMISPAEEDTCACRPQYFPDFKTEVGFLSNPLGPIGSKTRIAYFGSGSGTIAKGIAFDFDEDYFWVVKQENLLMLRVSDGSVVKTFSEYKTDTNFHSGSFKAIKRSMLTGDHIWMVANSEIYKINTADGLEICSYRPSENPRQFYVSKDETFLIFLLMFMTGPPLNFIMCM